MREGQYRASTNWLRSRVDHNFTCFNKIVSKMQLYGHTYWVGAQLACKASTAAADTIGYPYNFGSLSQIFLTVTFHHMVDSGFLLGGQMCVVTNLVLLLPTYLQQIFQQLQVQAGNAVGPRGSSRQQGGECLLSLLGQLPTVHMSSHNHICKNLSGNLLSTG